MTVSLQRQLSKWLSGLIVVGGLLAAAISFYLSFGIATASQDAQLDQIAAIMAREPFARISVRHLPRDIEEAETRFAIGPLGEGEPSSDTVPYEPFPARLQDGLQTTEIGGKRWRVMVRADPDGRRFAVAQTIEARIEIALGAAALVLLPLALLIPLLLIALRIVLRKSFESIRTLSNEADAIDGPGRLEQRVLEERDVVVELLPFVQAVNRLLARLGTAFDQQRRLVANAAHELRSPIHALTLQTQNIRAVPLGDDARERVEILCGGLERTTLLLDQLLGLARVQGNPERAGKAVDFAEVVRAAMTSVLPLANAKGLDLGCVALEGIVVPGTEDDAYLLVRNAIDNAVRYSPAGGTVDVSLRRADQDLEFVVEDSGPGIAQEEIPRAFEAFVRLAGHEESGSGLGLSIAKAAATALGGAIALSKAAPPLGGLRFSYRQALPTR